MSNRCSSNGDRNLKSFQIDIGITQKSKKKASLSKLWM